MITSGQNKTASKPTVVFYQVVYGWSDLKGNDHVTTVQVRTNRARATRIFKILEMPEYSRKDRKRAKHNFVRLYEVQATTPRDEYSRINFPNFNAKLIGTRWFD